MADASQKDIIALAEFLNSGNAEELDAEKAGIGNCYGYYFKQTADIDLTGVAWGSIGYSGSYYFAGNYDGAITASRMRFLPEKLTQMVTLQRAFFGWVAFGSVENLHVKNANFVATGQKNYRLCGRYCRCVLWGIH